MRVKVSWWCHSGVFPYKRCMSQLYRIDVWSFITPLTRLDGKEFIKHWVYQVSGLQRPSGTLMVMRNSTLLRDCGYMAAYVCHCSDIYTQCCLKQVCQYCCQSYDSGSWCVWLGWRQGRAILGAWQIMTRVWWMSVWQGLVLRISVWVVRQLLHCSESHYYQSD